MAVTIHHPGLKAETTQPEKTAGVFLQRGWKKGPLPTKAAEPDKPADKEPEAPKAAEPADPKPPKTSSSTSAGSGASANASD